MDRQWTVGASAALLAFENTALLAGLLFTGGPPTIALVAIAFKFWLCFRLVKLRLGALVTLILWESFTMAVALVNPAIPLPGQIFLFGSAMAASTLLALSIPTFAPGPDRLPRDLGGHPRAPGA